jgi:hypothetical protein
MAGLIVNGECRFCSVCVPVLATDRNRSIPKPLQIQLIDRIIVTFRVIQQFRQVQLFRTNLAASYGIFRQRGIDFQGLFLFAGRCMQGLV